MYKRCLNCAEKIKETVGEFKPEVAIVSGSGLGGIADKIKVEYSVEYSSLPDFPAPTVEGHRGRFLFGYLCGKPVAAAAGRVHLYEGYSPAEAVMPVRVLRLSGAKVLILTNAAGGINKDFAPGDIMLITDHISLFTESPLKGKNIDEFGTRFPDMTAVYDNKLRDIALSAAVKAGIELKTGVYAQVKGPQYETPAEIGALSLLGADAVGMSTAIEAIAARHAGMRVCGLSVITNMASGINKTPLLHSDVIENSKNTGKYLSTLIGEIINRL